MLRCLMLGLATVLQLSLAAMLYVGAYLGLADYGVCWDLDNPPTYTIGRTYNHAWMAWVFQPAGWTESMLRGVDVQVGSWVGP